jgi:hypothetical protein
MPLRRDSAPKEKPRRCGAGQVRESVSRTGQQEKPRHLTCNTGTLTKSFDKLCRCRRASAARKSPAGCERGYAGRWAGYRCFAFPQTNRRYSRRPGRAEIKLLRARPCVGLCKHRGTYPAFKAAAMRPILTAPYRSGASRDWLKIKNPDSPAMVRHRDDRW